MNKGLVSTATQYLAYLGYRALGGVAGALPLTVCARIGRIGGRIAWALAPRYRQLAGRNLRIAFGDEYNEAEVRVLIRRHFESLGGNMLMSFRLSAMAPEDVEARVRYEGREHLETAVAHGRGLIPTIAHLGPWELFSQLHSIVSGAAPGTMYRPLSNRFINDHVVAQRSRIGVKLFDRSTGTRGPLKHLRAGGAVGMLIDQHAGDLGVWCPFFDRLASTTNLPALLSLRTGAAVISIAILPDGAPDRWRIVYQPPHIPPDRVPNLAKAAATLTIALNEELEASVREAPEEWFWLHNRWKTPNPKFLLTTYKRGIHLPETAGAVPELKPFRLLLRSPNPLGDACMAMPAVRAIKRGRPDLHLTILCRENLAPVWRDRPGVDAVLAIPRSAKPRAVGKLIRSQEAEFDAAVLLPNSLSAALEVRFGKIPRIVGFRGHSRARLLQQIIPPLKEKGPPRHHAHTYLHLAEKIGAYISAEVSAVDQTQAQKFRPPRTAPPRLGVCPGAEYGAAKRWPEDRFGRVINRVRETAGNDCRVSLFGSPGERAIGEALAQLIDGDCDNRVGHTSLEELMTELQTCDVVLTNDTGTMHLAALLGVPTVAIFGSTEPLWTRPLGPGHRVICHPVECSPCFLRNCPLDFRCMNEIDPDAVVEAVTALLDEGAPNP